MDWKWNATQQNRTTSGRAGTNAFYDTEQCTYVCSNNAQPHIIFRRKFSGRSFLHVNYTGHTLPYSK